MTKYAVLHEEFEICRLLLRKKKNQNLNPNVQRKQTGLDREMEDDSHAAEHAVAEAAHSLKSSCGALSLNRSADLADTLEDKARSGGDAGDLSDLAAALQETFREELETVRSYLDRQM